MGRRKIEIKAIKDDRNRSVTFLKRKGGLFKKAHELSVLCSVDVAVIIFGANKKLYQYSSCDLRGMIARHSYHGPANEHKTPADFNGGGTFDEDDEDDGTPPQGDGMDPQMLPPHFQGQVATFPNMRHHTPSASPPMPTGVFAPHPGHPRGHTPQPGPGSRPSSRNDFRRIGMGMVPQQGQPQPQNVNGFAFVPQPNIYNPQNTVNLPPSMPPHSMPQVHPQLAYQQPPQPHTHQMQPYMEERRSSLPPNFPPQPQAPPSRHSASPPQPPAPQPPPQQPVQHMAPQPQVHPMRSPPQPQVQIAPPPPPPPVQQSQQEHQAPPASEPLPPPPVEPRKPQPADGRRQSLLLDTNIKKQPPRATGSIFTPIDENRSILSQHLAAFNPDIKPDPGAHRSQSIDVGSVSRSNATSSPPQLQRASTQGQGIKRNGSMSAIPETTFTPPSRSNSLRVGAGAGARPRLKVQIPDEPSDGGSATNESSSPRGTTATDVTSQPSRRPTDSHSGGVVLPPPSPSASALLSAGASGPPNPFARPVPHQNNMNIDTPVSALPSRFLDTDFLPSPSSWGWGFQRNDNNTLPSPLNFATPVNGTGPSFLRDDHPTPNKRKTPDISGNGPRHDHLDASNEAKRTKTDTA
ncbi:hypothetical protein QBC47DRAFT_154716 [Echria macrotheca]|uniref:MADS-box domain-containing protein n=1 Tax=Echria macrotheca TaxID=438768 RepID=A0AAJ0BG98_9PEZI|nr:hypothetical protein QBC47DRAFT_154716 [Echria macrotheca]